MLHKLTLVGFGNVARALTRLFIRKQEILKTQYNIAFSFTGIATGRHGFAVNPNGLDIQRALSLVESGKDISALSTTPVKDSLSVIQNSQADVMFENSPVNHSTGQPAIDHCRAALEYNMHAITANKGTVVHGYRELMFLAKEKGKRFMFEATVLGGAPVFSVFRETFPAAQLTSFQGILNSTTNLILSYMEQGRTFDAAVKYCQSIGIAETDPSHDVDGWDAAIKVAALVTVLMDVPFTPQQVDRTGIRDITSRMVERAKLDGKRYKLVCSAERMGDQIEARVAPELLSSSSPLFNMENSTTGISFRTDVLGDYSIMESEREDMTPGPDPTAYGLFADFINAVKP